MKFIEGFCRRSDIAEQYRTYLDTKRLVYLTHTLNRLMGDGSSTSPPLTAALSNLLGLVLAKFASGDISCTCHPEAFLLSRLCHQIRLALVH